MEEKKKKSIFKKWWFWVIIVILVVGVAGTNSETQNTISNETVSYEQNNKVAVSATENVMMVDYEELYAEYMDNPISADAKYRGKILEITGKVYDIDREILGNPYITFNIGGEYSLKNIRITFKNSQEDKVANLKKGQTITVRGNCTGTLLSITVALDECEIIE